MKVLIINPVILDYRLHIFNLLGQKVDLTIVHSGKMRNEPNINFKQIFLKQKKIGPFFYSAANLKSLCKQYDIVISEGNIRYIDRNVLILNPFRKFKWVTWGIGVSASYNKKFDEDKKLDFIRHFIFKRADAQVFYSEYPIQKYLKAGFASETLFVANNTTFVQYNIENIYSKKKLLFVGTLYKQKKIYELLEAYYQYSQKSTNSLPLDIIGDGSEYDNVKKWISTHKMEEKIILHGSIFDHSILEKHFREAYACISPGQAGLSVLTSMGYGTPFITQKEAITGGEIFNIKNHYNGVLYDSHDELKNIMKDIEMNKDKYLEMGENARHYYLNQRLPEQMVDGLFNACKFVFNSYQI